MPNPTSQFLVYGDPGSGKSQFAATFPKPLLVLNTDPRGKAMPYKRRGLLGEAGVIDDYGTPFETINSKKTGEMIITIEYYHDTNIKGGRDVIYAYERLEERLTALPTEVENGMWATVVLDSLSFLEYQARKLHQFKLNPTSNAGNTQDRRQWYDASADILEEFCYARFAGLSINVVMLAHIADYKTKIRDRTAWTMDAPGFKGRKLPGAFAEVYVLQSTEEGRYLQTENDTHFIATTQIMAPDGCVPHYKNLWSNWNKEDGI